MGTTNITAHTELAAIATAIKHSYSHIATDSLTSLHQLKKQLSHPNLCRHHIQGDVLQSSAKAIHQSPLPIHFHKVKSHAGTIGNECAMLLLKYQSQSTLTLRIPPSKQLALREIPSTISTGLQKNMKNTERIIQNQPNTAQSPTPQSFGTYLITMTPCKHTCTPFTN